MVQLLKQREGELCEIAMYHNLAINKIADSMEELNAATTYTL